jgi:hypothetical protein
VNRYSHSTETEASQTALNDGLMVRAGCVGAMAVGVHEQIVAASMAAARYNA